MSCKQCIQLIETSMMCKSCIKEHHDYDHPSDPGNQGKYFYGIPLCYCSKGIDILDGEIDISIGTEDKVR